MLKQSRIVAIRRLNPPNLVSTVTSFRTVEEFLVKYWSTNSFQKSSTHMISSPKNSASSLFSLKPAGEFINQWIKLTRKLSNPMIVLLIPICSWSWYLDSKVDVIIPSSRSFKISHSVL
ncbi:hypothetical protein OGAPHI_000112 [Ogataea philodendri]|uniref:Uncharacterized protein n=1 Tax=Ogataea philodendri TaxID=1378263 RepID=A0A9P8TAI4_9ASCO|nr:uncharacterized protein OGAPHI_000112 [Ogataea philodendri]KAH3671926.1 hypothetical protein OGAPHI_000112 [Ogataea philodendri]